MTRRTALVPLDGSETAETILPLAATIASALDLDLLLLDVVGGTPCRDSAATTSPLAGAERYLDAVAASLCGDGLAGHTQTIASSGEAAETIARMAAGTQVELVALATHGRVGPGHWAMGSVADAVVCTAACPALVMRSDIGRALTPIERILVAVDGTPASEASVPVAERFAAAFGAVLDLVLVQSLPARVGGAAFDAVASGWARERRSRVAGSYLERLTARIQPGVVTERCVLPGLTACELLGYAERSGADLIVFDAQRRVGGDQCGMGVISPDALCAGWLPVLLV